MKYTISNATLAAAFAASLAVASTAYAVSGDNGIHPQGEPASSNEASRVITITPDTKTIDVSPDAIVKFHNEQTGKDFVWAFDTPGGDRLDLGKVAPPEFLGGQQVEIYVDPRYMGD